MTIDISLQPAASLKHGRMQPAFPLESTLCDSCVKQTPVALNGLDSGRGSNAHGLVERRGECRWRGSDGTAYRRDRSKPRWIAGEVNRFLFGRCAKATVREIRDHISRDSPESARRLMVGLVATFRLLAKRPEPGHSREDLSSPDLRFWPVENYLLI